jgi:hypothetical protein
MLVKKKKKILSIAWELCIFFLTRMMSTSPNFLVAGQLNVLHGSGSGGYKNDAALATTFPAARPYYRTYHAKICKGAKI